MSALIVLNILTFLISFYLIGRFLFKKERKRDELITGIILLIVSLFIICIILKIDLPFIKYLEEIDNKIFSIFFFILSLINFFSFFKEKNKKRYWYLVSGILLLLAGLFNIPFVYHFIRHLL